MGLIVSPFQFAHVSEGLDSAPTNNQFGVAYTAGANDTKGTAVTALSALGHDAELLEIAIMHDSVSANIKRGLVDILIDPAGGTSWSVLIANLLVPPIPVAGTPIMYRFPLWVPAGASLGAQAQTVSTTTAAGRIGIRALGGANRPDAWWSGQGVESLGADTGTSGGGVVTAGSGSYGSWTNVGGITSHRYGALAVGLGGQSGAFYNGNAFWAEVGLGSFALNIGTAQWQHATAENLTIKVQQHTPFVDVPSGSQLQVRAQGSAANSLHFTLYGVY